MVGSGLCIGAAWADGVPEAQREALPSQDPGLAAMESRYRSQCDKGKASACGLLGVIRQAMGQEGEAVRAAYVKACLGDDLGGCALLFNLDAEKPPGLDDERTRDALEMRRCVLIPDARTCGTICARYPGGIEASRPRLPGRWSCSSAGAWSPPFFWSIEDYGPAFVIDQCASDVALGGGWACEVVAAADRGERHWTEPRWRLIQSLQNGCEHGIGSACRALAGRAGPQPHGLYWQRRACEIEEGDACTLLADRLRAAEGGQASPEVVRLYETASRRDSAAYRRLAEIYADDKLQGRDRQLASKCAAQGCEAGDGPSCLLTAGLDALPGQPQRPRKEWLRRACLLDVAEACQTLLAESRQTP
jgi:hypothetical protein